MLAALGLSSLDELIDQAVPPPSATTSRWSWRTRDQRARGHRPAAGPGRPQRGGHLAHRRRLPRHPHARRDPAQRAGEPGLVHGLHALPAGDQPGPAGGAAQLPDHGVRPHRHGDRQRLHARRGHRRRRGHDPGPPLHPPRRRPSFFVDAECHPQTIAVVATRAEPLGIEVVVGDPATDLVPGDVFGVLLQHPGTSGVVRDLRPVIEAVHGAGGLAVVATDLLACTLLVPPGELGADAAVGSSQRFGVPMGFGGPHAGFLATRDRLPPLAARPAGGRVGRRRRPPRPPPGAADPRAAHPPGEGHVQHLHRPGAAGRHGLDVRRVPRARGASPPSPRASTPRPARWPARLRARGFDLVHDTWFDTLTVRTPGQAAEITERARQAASTCGAWTATGWAWRSTRPRRRCSAACWRPSGSTPTPPSGRPGRPATGHPGRPSAAPASS